MHLLPFMIIDNDDMESAEMKIAIHLSKSGICSLHPMLRGWKKGKKFRCFFFRNSEQVTLYKEDNYNLKLAIIII